MGPHDRGVDRDAPVQISFLIGLGKQGGEDLLPGAVSGPLPQPVVGALPRAEVFGQVHPRDARAVLERDRVDHLPVTPPPPTPPGRPAAVGRLRVNSATTIRRRAPSRLEPASRLPVGGSAPSGRHPVAARTTSPPVSAGPRAMGGAAVPVVVTPSSGDWGRDLQIWTGARVPGPRPTGCGTNDRGVEIGRHDVGDVGSVHAGHCGSRLRHPGSRLLSRDPSPATRTARVRSLRHGRGRGWPPERLLDPNAGTDMPNTSGVSSCAPM